MDLKKIGFFITSHGFGHASRASAVMEAIGALIPSTHFHIFTEVPHWFFLESLRRQFVYHIVKTDVGLVQESPMVVDLKATVAELNAFFPFSENRLSEIRTLIEQTECDIILCDISPLGIAISNSLDIPSILIENFTWDWIYRGYVEAEFEIDKNIPYLEALFNSASYLIQSCPVCVRKKSVDLVTNPISRTPKMTRIQVREKLNIEDDRAMVLMTMGGIVEQYPAMGELAKRKDCIFVIPGSAIKETRQGNLILIPHHSGYFHPDLVYASDVVIGKSGYSTLAEVYYAGIPFGYLSRPMFRESGVLAEFINRKMSGVEIQRSDFDNGNWITQLDELLNLPRIERDRTNGADQIAKFLFERF
ncbi:MAG: hypothetical protein MUO76_16725 [Anaerolineaceae bacterium]|nr:hypothetical protein [Anaerolineaceae bacterium]